MRIKETFRNVRPKLQQQAKQQEEEEEKEEEFDINLINSAAEA
jgi:predicted DNA binding CopG/RHH family protein